MHEIDDRYSPAELSEQVASLQEANKQLKGENAVLQGHLVTMKNVLVEMLEKHAIGKSQRFRRTKVIDRNLPCDRDALRALSSIFDIVEWIDGFGCVHHFKWKERR